MEWQTHALALDLPLSVVIRRQALLPIIVVLFAVSFLTYTKLKRLPKTHPPIIHLTNHDIFENPKESYENALRNHGPVIGVKRKGNLEFIVSNEFAKQVLSDDAVFSFERGVTFTLNINFMQRLSKGRFFHQVDSVVSEGITTRLDSIIEQVYPVFYENVARAMQKSQLSPIDMFDLAHTTVSEAMILLILGESYFTPQMQRLVIATASGFAAMSGVTNNRSLLARRFPLLERLWERTKYAIFVGIPFVFKMAPAIWKDLSRLQNQSDLKDDVDPNQVTLMAILARQYVNSEGKLTWTSRIWIILIIVMLIFASVHQTASVMVWVVFELATRPEYLTTLREETNALMDPSPDPTRPPTLTYSALRQARYLDSFIREVMRTKGDTLGHIRVTTADTPLGGYVIPKGSPVLPLTTLSHLNPEYYGNQAHLFDGFRYMDTDKAAAMTGPGYLSFGLSRWACPGRFLAVAEIKMMVMSILSMSTPELEGGKYRVVDKLNVTSVPPAGELILKPLL